MKVCVSLIFSSIVLSISLIDSRSLLLRISKDYNAGRLSFVNTNKLRTLRKEALSNPLTIERSFKPLPFPVDYSLYDRNGDAMIDIKELIRVTGTAENVQAAFDASDLNGDGFVTEDEYKLKPWGYDPDDAIVENEENYDIGN